MDKQTRLGKKTSLLPASSIPARGVGLQPQPNVGDAGGVGRSVPVRIVAVDEGGEGVFAVGGERGGGDDQDPLRVPGAAADEAGAVEGGVARRFVRSGVVGAEGRVLADARPEVVAAGVAVEKRRPVGIVELRGADRVGRGNRLVNHLPGKDGIRVADGPHPVLADRDEDGEPPLSHFSAYAAPAGQGTFLFLATERLEKEEKNWALVRESPFPALTRLAREHDLARDNGFHSRTHGLPQNFGGEVDIRYASGERISFSDNQTPILSPQAGQEIVRFFRTAMRGEKVPLPDLADLATVRFEEQRKDGGFTTATLTLLPDGSGSNEKRSRYDGSKIYESIKPVDKETVAAIKETIEEAGLVAWASLPDNGFSAPAVRSLTFTFDHGAAITVTDGKLIPDPLSRAFFSIQLELETKH